jgi:hypothetical protein
MRVHLKDQLQSCIFCPNEAGAFKQTTEAKWAHLLCALFIPELTLGNQVFMEPIEGVNRIPKSRWKLVSNFGALSSIFSSRFSAELFPLSVQTRGLHTV